VASLITSLVTVRLTYGYRWTTALLNRQLQSERAGPANQKRVYARFSPQHLSRAADALEFGLRMVK
jgi:hypothetical protein